MELVLEQTQQGTSYEVSVSAKGVEELKRKVKINGEKKEALLTLRFQVNPKTSHLSAVKRIFRYLKGKPKLGLWYPRVSSFDLEAYSDSDYAGANLDRKSTTGGCQFLGRRLISWKCKKQTIMATSTAEAEYVAAANFCGQVLWIQNQMLDYGFNLMNTKIYIDNESTICIVKNPIFYSKTKHIAIRNHFIRDAYEKKLIQVLKIHTDDNVADLLTKAFDDSRGFWWESWRSSSPVKIPFREDGDMTTLNLDKECLLKAKIGGKEVLEETVDAKGVYYMDTENAQDMGRSRFVVHSEKEREEKEVSTDDALVPTRKKIVPTKKKIVPIDQMKVLKEEVLLQQLQHLLLQLLEMMRLLLNFSKDYQKIKAKEIEEEDESDTESEGIPEAEKKFKQLARDEEMARKNEYDFIQARIKADRLLALRLQDEERESSSLWKREQNSFMIQFQLKEGILQNKEWPNVNTGRVNVNSVKSNVNTGRTNVNPVRPRVNTGSSNVNTRQPGNWGTAVKTSAGKERVLNSPCFMVKSWLVQDQTVLGKDYSNLLIADSLLKTIWFINAPCYGNEALASPKANGVW
ncbi:hypothetical protein Tco_0842676 [Tanacetum coccineum]|uniref:Uncharacterized protein n=1 Tax=Tanacetum coccineum TaxID=301880 RepID=A0ABQ5B5L6_9ASTR